MPRGKRKESAPKGVLKLSSYTKVQGTARCIVCNTEYVDDLPYLNEVICPKGCKSTLIRST